MMLEDNGSINAHAPLTVVNTRGFDAPGKGRMPVTVLLWICAMWKTNKHHAQTQKIIYILIGQNAYISVANSTGYDTIKVTCPIWAIMKGELQCVLAVQKRSKHRKAVWA